MQELEAISALVERLGDPADPVHHALTADLATTSGLHPSSVAELLRLWTAGWQRTHLDRLLRRGLGAHPGMQQPVGRVAIVAPGNLFVATWQAIAEALLAGNEVTVRPGSGDPRAAANFHAALALVDPRLAARLEPQGFARGDEAAWHGWLRTADALLIYGGDPAISAVLQLASAAGFTGRIRLHGHFQSLGVLAVDVLQDPAALASAAQGWAIDALLADGRGCMSLRALWLVGPATDADRHQLRAALHTAFAEVAQRFPPGQIAPQWQAAGQLDLANHAFAAATQPGHWLEQGDSWAILGRAAGLTPDDRALGPGGRLVRVHEARDGHDLYKQLAPWRGKLSTASLALDADRHNVHAALARLGVHRTCLPGRMQAPLADRAPDGHPPFTGLYRQTDRA